MMLTTNYVWVKLAARVIVLLALAGYSEADSLGRLKRVHFYCPSPLKVKMYETVKIDYEFEYHIEPNNSYPIVGDLCHATLTPRLQILERISPDIPYRISEKQLKESKGIVRNNVTMSCNYIGHAYLFPCGFDAESFVLPVTVERTEGIWEVIFVISVSILMIVNFINFGAQLDTKKLGEVINRPKTLLFGYLITILVMPLIAFKLAPFFLVTQNLFISGSFIYACSPSATATSLWAAMFKSNTELAIVLQLFTSIGTMITMPLMLYLMNYYTKNYEVYQVSVAYTRLMFTLFTLILALIIGYKFVRTNNRLKKLSAQIHRPLTIITLSYIILFSLLVYWWIYRMIDYLVAVYAVLIVLASYFISGILGYLINCNINDAISISLASGYKNSGIAVTILLVAFGSPDAWIAFVPSLAQVVVSSLFVYIIFGCHFLFNCLRECTRRIGQPGPIRATYCTDEPDQPEKRSLQRQQPEDQNLDTAVDDPRPEDARSHSIGEKSNKSADESVALSVSGDLPNCSPAPKRLSIETKVQQSDIGSRNQESKLEVKSESTRQIDV